MIIVHYIRSYDKGHRVQDMNKNEWYIKRESLVKEDHYEYVLLSM